MVISIHALLAESDLGRNPAPRKDTDFYPRSPCGERLLGNVVAGLLMLFLSTLSLRRATSVLWMALNRLLFLSTLSLRRATVWAHQRYFPPDISIHALLAESDNVRITHNPGPCYFYPRSPCGERPAPQQENGQAATISIHALLAESDYPTLFDDLRVPISIHALLAESDTPRLSRVVPTPIFLSTLSLRRATGPGVGQGPPDHDFYPRSPCGERRQVKQTR